MPKKNTKKKADAQVQDAIDRETAEKTQGFDKADFKQISKIIWKPQLGEYIIGAYEGYELTIVKADDGTEHECKSHIVIDADTGQRISFIGGVSVDMALETAQVEPGEIIYAEYMEQQPTGSGKKRVNIWDVRVKR